jgi:hypothetical protein
MSVRQPLGEETMEGQSPPRHPHLFMYVRIA